VVRWMEVNGVTAFFHVPGESFLPVLDALRDSVVIQTITTRHEGGAAFAAEAFGKITGFPAVCMATRGPGAANLGIGVQTAFYDGTPLIALLGLVPRRLQGSGAFQEIDPASLFASTAKSVLTVNSPDALLPILDQALSIAITGRPGPVVVGLPTDVLFEPAVGTLGVVTSPRLHAGAAFDAYSIVARIGAAARPVLLAATDAVRGPASRCLETVAAKMGMPVYCAWRRYSAFDNAHPRFEGSIGLGTSAEVLGGLSSADLVISFGFGLEQVTCDTAGFDPARTQFIQFAPAVDTQLARRIPGASVEQVVTDPQGAAELLAQAVLHSHVNRPVSPSEPARPSTAVTADSNSTGGVNMAYAMARLDDVIPADAIVTCDAGNFAQWMIRHVRFGGARTFVGALNGAMGYGLPAGIGSAIAAPERPIWVLSGDGGFAMLEAEMETAVRGGADLVACVFDNEIYGTIRARQESAYPGRDFGTATGPINFADAARAHGWRAWTVRRDRDLASALEEASAARGCRLVHLRVDPVPLSPY
jgi:acetolactate synthase-1/2/3 large subunit